MVTGHDDLLVYRAQCCNPIRGEDIVGYVTRGKGVAVHSKACPNVTNLMYEPDRRIAVEWGKDAAAANWQAGYPVKLAVHCDNRPGMLKQIATVISDANTNIRNIEAARPPKITPPLTWWPTSPTSSTWSASSPACANPRRARRAAHAEAVRAAFRFSLFALRYFHHKTEFGCPVLVIPSERSESRDLRFSVFFWLGRGFSVREKGSAPFSLHLSSRPRTDRGPRQAPPLRSLGWFSPSGWI